MKHRKEIPKPSNCSIGTMIASRKDLVPKEASKSQKMNRHNVWFRMKGQSQTSERTKTDKRKLRQTQPTIKASADDPVPDDPPKLEGETNTSSTKDGRFDQDERGSCSSSSSYSHRENLSSSRSGSSNTQSSYSGLLEHNNGNRFINASRVIFFLILGISAIVIAVLAHYIFKANEIAQFQKQVCKCERIIKFRVKYDSCTAD